MWLSQLQRQQQQQQQPTSSLERATKNTDNNNSRGDVAVVVDILTPCLAKLHDSHIDPASIQPVLQVTQSKPIQDKRPRHLVVLNDGRNTMHGTIFTDEKPAPAILSVIKLLQYTVVQIDPPSPSRLVAIQSYETVASPTNAVLGSPSEILTGTATTTTTSAPLSSLTSPQNITGRGSVDRGVPTTQPPLGPASVAASPTQTISSATRTQVSPGSEIPSDDLSKSVVVPVAGLNPFQTKWVIKVRVTSKSDIRNYTSTKGSGKFFTVDLLDDQGTEIQMTGFQDVIEKFYELLQPNHVYLISKCLLKFANKPHITTIKNDYELSLTSGSIIQEVQDDHTIKTHKMELVEIKNIASRKINDVVDVLGIVMSVGKGTKVKSSEDTSVELSKKSITIMDSSGVTIQVALWGEKADRDIEREWIIAIRSAKISDLGGISLSASSASTVIWNPADMIEADKLREWYSINGHGNVTPIVNIHSESTNTSAIPIVNLEEHRDLENQSITKGIQVDPPESDCNTLITANEKEDTSAPAPIQTTLTPATTTTKDAEACDKFVDQVLQHPAVVNQVNPPTSKLPKESKKRIGLKLVGSALDNLGSMMQHVQAVQHEEITLMRAERTQLMAKIEANLVKYELSLEKERTTHATELKEVREQEARRYQELLQEHNAKNLELLENQRTSFAQLLAAKEEQIKGLEKSLQEREGLVSAYREMTLFYCKKTS